MYITGSGEKKFELGFFLDTPDERHVMVGILFVLPPTADVIGVGLGGAEVDQRDFLLHFGKREVFHKIVIKSRRLLDLLFPVTSCEEADKNEQEGERDGKGFLVHGKRCGHVFGYPAVPLLILLPYAKHKEELRPVPHQL